MGFGIWDWDGNGIWDWDGIWDWGGIMTNGMGWDGYGMGFDTNGNWDSPIPISTGGKYRRCHTRSLTMGFSSFHLACFCHSYTRCELEV